jgi:hypothetical protein
MGKKQKIPAEQRAAMAAQAEQMEMLKKLPLPELQELVLKNPELVGLLEAEELGPSALEDVQTDPRLKQAQMQALQSIKERSEKGLTPEDKLAMEEMLGQADASAKSRQQGLMQEMASRGTLDSGAQLAASLSGQQADASNARQKAMQMAAQSSANRAQAAQQMGSMAGQMEQADYGRGANLASAKDRIAQANTAARMQTNQQNLAARQAIENQKAALQNQSTMYNIGRDQQQFQNQLAKAGAGQSATNAYAQMAASMPQKGSGGQAIGTLIGAGIGAYAGGPKGAAEGMKAGAGLGGAFGSLFKDGGVIHAKDGNVIHADGGALIYRPQNTEAQVPDLFQTNETPAMLTPPPVSQPQTKVPSGLDIFSKKLTDNELKNTFNPQRSEYVTKESADIPFRPEYGGMGGSGKKIESKAPSKKVEGLSNDTKDKLSAMTDIVSSLSSQKPQAKPELKLDTNVQFAQPENVLAQRLQAAQQFANPFAAQDGGTYYKAENGDLMHKSNNQGNVVKGDSYAGDRVDAKLNSGEMVLNVSQQQRLMDLLRGKADLQDLGDKDIVEGVPREYQEQLKAKAKFNGGGTVLSDEELEMQKASELAAMQEAEEMEPTTQPLQRQPASVQEVNQEAKSPNLQTKEEQEEEFDPAAEHKKILSQYNKMVKDYNKEEPVSQSMKNWSTFADIMDRAAANYNPYYKPLNMDLAKNIEQKESTAKTQKLDQLSKMAELLSKYQGAKTPSSKNIYKVGNDLVRVTDKGAERLYGDSKDSVFEKEKMKQLAKTGVEYQTKDRPQLISNLDKINKGINILKSGKDSISGGFVGYLPDAIRTEDSISARDSIQSAIQETLRPTLGAQFTEKEGERIMSLQYNEKLSEKENLKRAKELEKVIKNKVKFSDDLYEYVNKNGSDKGFPYDKYGMAKTGKEQSITQSGYTESQERGIEKVMKANKISREKAIQALKEAGKL